MGPVVRGGFDSLRWLEAAEHRDLLDFVSPGMIFKEHHPPGVTILQVCVSMIGGGWGWHQTDND